MYIIKNAKIHIGNGEILENSDIIIDGKIIKQIGKNLSATNAEIIDGTNKEVFPGFIDPTSSIGAMGIPTSHTDNAEKSNPLMPEMDISYSIDPDEVTRQEFYKSGITTVGLSPNNTCVVGGQIAVFKTAQDKFSNRLVAKKVAMKCAVTSEVKSVYGERNTMPMTKMGIFGLINDTVLQLENKEEKDYTTKDKEFKKLVNGEINPIISAETKSELDAAIEVFSKMSKKLTFVDAYEFDRSLDAILATKSSLIIGNISYLSQATKHNMQLCKLKDVIENGNLVAFTNTCVGYSEGREVLIWTAIDVYRAGIKSEDVVQMLTLNPAKILGVDNRIGSIEVGKDADIAIFSANPVETYAAKAETVLINGEVIYNV
ncbi:MAG: amidohydrolase family protein [Oscillospiraceae bacterium]